MSLQANIEEEIAIFEKIRQALMEKGYNPKDINKIIDYINDTVTNISVSIVRESEVSEKLSSEKIKRISNELQSNIDLIFEVLNTELDSKLPSNFKWNLSEDFISRTLNEIIPSSAKPIIKEEPLVISGNINVHVAKYLFRGTYIDENLARSRAIDGHLARSRAIEGHLAVASALAKVRAIDEPSTRDRAIDEPLIRDRVIDGHLAVASALARVRAIDEPLTRDRAIQQFLKLHRTNYEFRK